MLQNFKKHISMNSFMKLASHEFRDNVLEVIVDIYMEM